MMAWIRYVCFIVGLMVFLPELLSAQRLVSQRQEDIEAGLLYNESVYVLSNYSCLSSNSPEKLSLDELLKKQIEGFYFYLKRDAETNVLLLRKPDGTFTPFNESLNAIKNALDADPHKVMTLFLDFYVETELESSFKESGLMEYVLEYDARNGWPSLKDMLSTGKRLVVFEVQKHLNSPSWLHNMRDFVEHTDADWGNQSEEVESFDERLKKSLSLFAGYKFLETSRGNSNDISALARQTPYLIESFKRAWVRDGRIPNFILVDKYYAWLDVSLVTFRNFEIIYGTVTSNNELLNYVNWEGMSNYTTGKYCFPLEPGAELMLSPVSPGYKIEPATVYVSGTQRKAFAGDFKARPLRIDEDIEIYLPFDGDEKDDSYNRNRTVSRNVEFIQDPIRGQVASLEDQARVDLPTASELHMRDHDFTVGVWLKIPKYMPEKEDYCILGAKNSTYQQALHLLIRNRKPYMGFFNNDLVGNTVIEPGKWYNIVWRYNKSNGEQAIFVNGELDAISFDRPAYLGSDSLYVGFVNFSQSSNFVGVLDNLCIWSRVLSDKEILGLSNQLLDLHVSDTVTWLDILGIALILVILVSAAYLGYRRVRKRKPEQEEACIEARTEVDIEPEDSPRETPEVEEVVNVEEETQVRVEEEAQVEVEEETGEKAEAEKVPVMRNYIRLFGDFYVLDRDGNDITSLFTPKLKQLFILIMLYSSRGGSGISSRDLTRMIWGGNNSVKNVKSLRSVSILKLRKILERIDTMEIAFNANRYILLLSENVYCDYWVCLDLLKDKRVRTLPDFERFYDIISKGEVFKGESFDWMDDFKSYICNSTVDILSRFIDTYSIEDEADRVIQLADQILINDPCNEEALVYKIRALIYQNNFKLARYVYDRFCALYQDMYGEAFPSSFERIVPTSVD
nr:LamG-like jellyroll fold domain-containing protein [uncultured Parabacteroides sp.]